jgi:hypothetical protein
MINLLALVGACVLGAAVFTLAYFVGRGLRKIHRVANDYHALTSTDDALWGDQNYLRKMSDAIDKDKERMYKAERDASNASHRIACHEFDYKHTRTVKKIAYDKKIKKLEKERGGGTDGM